MPLAQASDGSYDNATLYFTRFAWQGSNTKRYRGGTAQNIWRFAPNAEHAQPLTADYDGTSRSPMVWKGRVYFASDRDGTMNLWSMDASGKDVRQHTHYSNFDVRHNNGGNIDSWLLERLMRKAWFYWQARTATRPGTCSMHFAAMSSSSRTRTRPPMARRSAKGLDDLA